MDALKWKLASGINRRTAEGRYPGWWYELVGGATTPEGKPAWTAWFHDGQGSPQRLGSGDFNAARKAARIHHERDEAWI